MPAGTWIGPGTTGAGGPACAAWAAAVTDNAAVAAMVPPAAGG